MGEGGLASLKHASRPPLAAAGAPPAADAPPWHVHMVAGVQRNCQEIASNLGRVRAVIAGTLQQQQQQLVQQAARRPHAAPAASLSWHGGAGAPPGTSKEEVGRATWVFLHTLAAQYPERPTRQQQRDVRNLVDILTRMYPCAECARHFGEVVASHPPRVASRADLELWTCEVHNVVNRSLGKPTFNCRLVGARWGALECGGEDGGAGNACALDLGGRR